MDRINDNMEGLIEKELKRSGLKILDAADMQKFCSGVRVIAKRLKKRPKCASGKQCKCVHFKLTFIPNDPVQKEKRKRKKVCFAPKLENDKAPENSGPKKS